MLGAEDTAVNTTPDPELRAGGRVGDVLVGWGTREKIRFQLMVTAV